MYLRQWNHKSCSLSDCFELVVGQAVRQQMRNGIFRNSFIVFNNQKQKLLRGYEAERRIPSVSQCGLIIL